ncbi:hypothetical protein D3C72_2154580 [compost metagenome]
MDRDAVRSTDATERGGTLAHVEIGAAQAHHPVALPVFVRGHGWRGKRADHGAGGDGSAGDPGTERELIHDVMSWSGK